MVRATTICRGIIGVRDREELKSKKREIVGAIGIEEVAVAFQGRGVILPRVLILEGLASPRHRRFWE